LLVADCVKLEKWSGNEVAVKGALTKLTRCLRRSKRGWRRTDCAYILTRPGWSTARRKDKGSSFSASGLRRVDAGCGPTAGLRCAMRSAKRPAASEAVAWRRSSASSIPSSASGRSVPALAVRPAITFAGLMPSSLNTGFSPCLQIA